MGRKRKGSRGEGTSVECVALPCPSPFPPEPQVRRTKGKNHSLGENLSSNSDFASDLELSDLRSDSSDGSNDLVSASEKKHTRASATRLQLFRRHFRSKLTQRHKERWEIPLEGKEEMKKRQRRKKREQKVPTRVRRRGSKKLTTSGDGVDVRSTDSTVLDSDIDVVLVGEREKEEEVRY